MTNSFSRPRIAGVRILIIEGEQSWENGILSAFPLLGEMMQRVRCSKISQSKLLDQEEASEALPCEYFDYIIGSGEGGWLALMLGRLRMSVSQARKAYIGIRQKVVDASPEQRAAIFEECLKDMVETMTISSNQDERLQVSNNRLTCQSAVLAMTSAHLAAPAVFRTYSIRKHATENCPIWTAIRACTADPKVFSPARIAGQRYISASIADNSNPVDVALDEVKMLWSDTKIGAVVSIGSGHRGPISADSLDFTEHLARDPGQSWQRTLREGDFPYYRFSVDQGLQQPSPSKADVINTIFAHSINYLRNAEIDEKMDEVASRLSAQISPIPRSESSEELPTTSTLRAKDSPSSLASMFSRGRRTRIHHNVSTKPLARLYTEELYKAGHGLPLWDPQPLFKGKPVEIGDVGLITEDGGFEILFNATVPAEEQEQYRLPPNFSPLMINHMDIQVSPEVTSAPYIVCGDVKLQERDFPEATGTDVKDAHEFEFAFSAMKGAALVLSNSPVRLSVRPSHRIRSYIEKYAESWYYFLEKDTSGPQLILNGQSLVFVTGVCRNSKWAVGAWDNNNVRSEVSYFGSATVSDDNTLTLSGNWESPGHDTKQGPSSARGDPLPRLRPQDSSDLSEHLAAPSQCLFVRGFTIAAKHVQEVDPHNVFPQPSWIQNAWKSLRLGIPPILRAAAEPHDPPPPPPPPSSPAVPSRGTSPGPNSVIQDIPTQRPPQHPSRGLTDLIFNFLPAARFAVVHDDDVYGTMTGTHPCQMMLDANNVVSLSFPESTTPEDCPAERGDLASTMPPAQPFRYDSDARERHHITEVSQPIPPIQFPTRNTTRHESSNRLPQIFTPLVVDYTDIQVSSAVTSAPYIARGDMKPQERGFLDGTRAGKKDAQELDLTSSATRGATVALSDPPIRLRVRPSHRIHSNIEKNTESRAQDTSFPSLHDFDSPSSVKTVKDLDHATLDVATDTLQDLTSHSNSGSYPTSSFSPHLVISPSLSYPSPWNDDGPIVSAKMMKNIEPMLPGFPENSSCDFSPYWSNLEGTGSYPPLCARLERIAASPRERLERIAASPRERLKEIFASPPPAIYQIRDPNEVYQTRPITLSSCVHWEFGLPSRTRLSSTTCDQKSRVVKTFIQKQAATWSALRIPTLHSFGIWRPTLASRHYLVSPFTVKRNLLELFTQVMLQHPLPCKLDMTEGIQYLHDSKIGHGDIRTVNILIEDSTCCLSDFEIAPLISANQWTSGRTLPSTMVDLEQVFISQFLQNMMMRHVLDESASTKDASHFSCLACFSDNTWSYGPHVIEKASRERHRSCSLIRFSVKPRCCENLFQQDDERRTYPTHNTLNTLELLLHQDSLLRSSWNEKLTRALNAIASRYIVNNISGCNCIQNSPRHGLTKTEDSNL